MEVRVLQVEGVRFKIQARTHTVVCDQPAEAGGADAGMTPPELFLASLGSCAAFYAAEYLRARNLAEAGVAVSVSAEKLKSPARLGHFHVQVASPVPLTADQQEGVMRSVHHCLIHNTLLTPVAIEFEVTAPHI